jgi:hypothetical protein
MKVIRLSDTRMLILFPARKEQTLSMFRFSEFSEGKEGIKGCHFTFDEFLDAYSDKDGNLNYFSFWDGFNVPIREMKQFQRVFPKNELSKREKKIIKAIRLMPIDGTLITCEKGDTMTLKHETAHCKFADNESYRKEVLDVVHSIDFRLKKKFEHYLLGMGYSGDVVKDEIHAYILAYEIKEYDEIFPQIDFEDIEGYHNKLNIIYNRYE